MDTDVLKKKEQIYVFKYFTITNNLTLEQLFKTQTGQEGNSGSFHHQIKLH